MLMTAPVLIEGDAGRLGCGPALGPHPSPDETIGWSPEGRGPAWERPGARPADIERDYRAGMPQLCHAGLSENWLFKECGDLHWQALARAQGRAEPAFRDAAGRTAYAAFTALRVSRARLQHFGENEAFSLSTRCVPLGRSQHYGLHALHQRGECSAQVEMLSAFVSRHDPGDNRSVVRASVGEGGEPAEPGLLARARAWQAQARSLRNGLWCERMGLQRAARREQREFHFTPCPNGDFNGARFLYFASFQAIADRALWAWFRATPVPALVDREMFFYGNVNVGESLRVLLCGERESGDEHVSWCEIRRTCDNARLADVFTRKRRAFIEVTRERAGPAGSVER